MCSIILGKWLGWMEWICIPHNNVVSAAFLQYNGTCTGLQIVSITEHLQLDNVTGFLQKSAHFTLWTALNTPSCHPLMIDRTQPDGQAIAYQFYTTSEKQCEDCDSESSAISFGCPTAAGCSVSCISLSKMELLYDVHAMPNLVQGALQWGRKSSTHACTWVRLFVVYIFVKGYGCAYSVGIQCGRRVL